MFKHCFFSIMITKRQKDCMALTLFVINLCAKVVISPVPSKLSAGKDFSENLVFAKTLWE